MAVMIQAAKFRTMDQSILVKIIHIPDGAMAQRGLTSLAPVLTGKMHGL